MRTARTIALTLLAIAALAGCESTERTFGERVRDTVDPPSGPVERAGRSTDRAIDRITPR